MQKKVNEAKDPKEDTKAQTDLDPEKEKEEETFAPAISWSAVRLLPMLSVIPKLKTHQIDFGNAFTQAHLDKPVHLDSPEGFVCKDKSMTDGGCVKSKRNLCGGCFGPALWRQRVQGI